MKKDKTLREKDEAEIRKLTRKKNQQKKTTKRKYKSKLFPNTWHLKSKPYYVFLQSDYWRVVRKMVLDRDNYQCVICKSSENLEVHHDSYKHHFSEHKHLEDLMVLCRSCHKEHHYSQ